MISATIQHNPPNSGPAPWDLARFNLEDDVGSKHQYYLLVMSA